ncbi:MAG: low molecular weight protein-tyrosine-phosphatase [Sporichthyaceae bacterium]
MVCTGNICRSPIAASVLRSRLDAAGLGARVSVSSAGTWDLHRGSPMDPRARATLERHGYPVDHVARHFQPDEFDRHDLILVTDRWNVEHLQKLAAQSSPAADIRLIRSFDPTLEGEHNVPDPFDGTLEHFERVLDQLERACDGLVAHLLRARPWREGEPGSPRPAD